MDKRKDNPTLRKLVKKRYHLAPHIWYSFLNVLVSVFILGILCLGLFVWLTGEMRTEDTQRCESVHERIQEVEDECNAQIRNIYKDTKLLSDFWLFWNHTMADYMEQRIRQNDIHENTESFPEYMNIFITEHQNVFCKIYFVTGSAVYALSARPEGGGGVYSYNIPYNLYIEETQNHSSGYPISVNIQDINDKKTNQGLMVFLVNYDYLFEGLKTPYNHYVMLNHGNVARFWGDESKKEESPDFLSYWSVYECDIHSNRIEIGFGAFDVFLKNWPFFAAAAGAVLFIACMMENWIWQMAKSNAKFLDAFIHSIQLAQKGQFQQIDVRERSDNYAMLAKEINDMTRNLDLLIKKEYLLKISQQQTEMKAMLYQINPHFLYNTLEIIRAQANIAGNIKVSDALFDLGSMYRMLSKLNDVIPMRQEISLLTHYLNILEIGNQENFYYDIDVAEEMMELDTVKFWMQPLAENYFVHGYDRTKEYNLFSVQGRKKENCYRIRIMDNGVGMDEKEIEQMNLRLKQEEGFPRENIGIRNVCQRLKYFYRNKMTFQILKNKPKGICIEICIDEDWKRG